MNRLAAVLLLAVFGDGPALARRPEFDEFRAVQESLCRVPPKMRAEWLRKHGLEDSRYTTYWKPETTGLRLVGKYGRGPSVEVTGTDSLVALTLGSEVALLSFANPDSPEVLSEIQLSFIPMQSALYDSFLLTCGNGLEVWNIENPRQPVFRHVIPYGVGGFAIADTFLYFVSQDTFHAYSITRPASPYRVGFCRDSGGVVAATRNVAVLRQPGDMLGFVDVTDPTSPRQVGAYPGYTVCADARGSICCGAFYWSTDEDHFRFDVLDISDPTNVTRIGTIDSVGGWDVHLSGPFAFVSGFQTSEWEFTIVDLQDSTNPHVVSSCATPSDNYGVWAEWTSDWAYVADMTGLAVIDIANVNAPVLDTSILKADLAEDVSLAGNRAYVADYRGGLRLLDVTDPTRPVELGGMDSTVSTCWSAVARDSFAFAGWRPNPYFRAVEVSDPAQLSFAGVCRTFDIPMDMVLRDTLIYCAERLRFQVINVARPREPLLVGSCVLSGTPTDLWLSDTLAFASRYIVSIANPVQPVLLGTLPAYSGAVAVRDSWVFAPELFDSMSVYNIADVRNPLKVASLALSGGHIWNSGVELVDSFLYIGGDILHVVNVANPPDPVEVGSWLPPREIRRLQYNAPYLYAACWDAGVCVLETTGVGIAEVEPVQPARAASLTVGPNPVRGGASIGYELPKAGHVRLQVYDIAGKLTRTLANDIQKPGYYNMVWNRTDNRGRQVLNGIYFCQLTTDSFRSQKKVVLVR